MYYIEIKQVIYDVNQNLYLQIRYIYILFHVRMSYGSTIMLV